MLGCLMGSCSSAGWCKAQLLCGSSPVGRCSGATPACTEYCLGYSLPRPIQSPVEHFIVPREGCRHARVCRKRRTVSDLLIMAIVEKEGKTVEVGRAHFATENTRFTILDAPEFGVLWAFLKIHTTSTSGAGIHLNAGDV
ncbi:uncharacterized protein [Triticum aestivum]|nr:uncharacterized protein LOC123058315 isoform X2 [Triticum aestivum]